MKARWEWLMCAEGLDDLGKAFVGRVAKIQKGFRVKLAVLIVSGVRAEEKEEIAV